MLKTLRTACLFLLASPLLIQCVPSQDVNSLDLRLRNLDNQVFLLGKTVNKLGGGTGTDNPIERIQARQAEMSDNIDRLSSEVMQLKGKLEESSHRTKLSQSDSTGLQRKVEDLSVQLAALSDQVNQNTSALKSGQPLAAAGTGKAVLAPEHVVVKPQTHEPVAKAEVETAPEPAKTASKPLPKSEDKKVEDKKVEEKKVEDKKGAEEAESGAAGDPGKAIYDQGLELFRASKFNEAYRTFSDYITKYPKGKMASNARFWLGDCYYNQQEYELAILEYQKVIADYPSDGKAPSALLKQGLAFEKLKDNDTAKIVYNKLLKDYPKSDQVETAKKRLESIK